MSAALPRSRHSSGNSNVEPRKLGKNVYILGSGFSAGMGMPTIARFIPDGLSLLKTAMINAGDGMSKGRARVSAAADDANLLAKVLKLLDRYRSVVSLVTRGEPNIQDYFCAVDSVDDEANRTVLKRFFVRVWQLACERHEDGCGAMANGSTEPHADCHRPYAPSVPRHLAWLHLVRPHFEVSQWSSGGQPLACAYEAFLAHVCAEAVLGCEPAIVSLNYDVLLERKLEALTAKAAPKLDRGFIFDFRLRPDRSAPSDRVHRVPYLKLHGSFNWQQNGARILINGIDRLDAEAAVMPGWVRGQTAGGAILAAEALRHLRTAERIYIIGYSMAPIDLDVRYLLCQAMDTPEVPEIGVYSKMAPEEAGRAVAEFFGRRAKLAPASPDYDLLAFLRDHKPPAAAAK